MRTIVLCMFVCVAGCSAPLPESSESAPLVLAPAPGAAPFAPEIAPMPRAVRPRTNPDPIMDGLHRGSIKAGDSLAEVAKLDARYELTRNGAFAVLENPDCYGGTRLIAKNDKLLHAEWMTCTYCRVYFNEMTKEDEAACWDGYREAHAKQRGFIAPPPREVGKPKP